LGAAFRTSSKDLVAIIDHIRDEVGQTPAYSRMDNEPGFIADFLQNWRADSEIKAT